MLDKKALRKEIGAMKRAMSPELIEAYSRDLTEKFCRTEYYKNAASVYVYLPYNQEVRTWDIVKRAWADGKRVAVPKVYGDIMRFLWMENFDQLAPGGWDIPEPTFDEPVADDETALTPRDTASATAAASTINTWRSTRGTSWWRCAIPSRCLIIWRWRPMIFPLIW